jgi:predicted RNA-binding Zn ribbon-like protein
MDERDKRRVGEQIEPGGRPKAPGRLALLQRFLNTLIHDFDIDRLGTAEEAGTWLSSKGLLEGADTIDDADAARLRRLREGLRALARANHGLPLDRPATGVIRRASRGASLTVEVSSGGTTSLVAAGRGADAAAATILAILHEAELTGEWSRLKVCRQCTYAFYDRSKNRSASWCSMSICGNRTKNRSYRARRSITRSPRRSS